MKLPIPSQRNEILEQVLKYCSDNQQVGKPACFSPLERMCINQERGALLSQLNPETPESDIRYYECPPRIEAKIQFTIQKVNNKLNTI